VAPSVASSPSDFEREIAQRVEAVLRRYRIECTASQDRSTVFTYWQKGLARTDPTYMSASLEREAASGALRISVLQSVRTDGVCSVIAKLREELEVPSLGLTVRAEPMPFCRQ
jgi:hypothetical protein